MLNISNIEELRSKVAHKEEIREANAGDGQQMKDMKTFCYMIAGDSTFDDAWSRECRGIVFAADGSVAGRPLHKFFNLNERAETQVNEINWGMVARVMEKRDGSMIHTVIVPHDSHPDKKVARVKSKKSFESDVASAALNWLYDKREYQALLTYLCNKNCTAIFEYTSPGARIVLFYPDTEMRLLHVRENVSGRYFNIIELEELAKDFGVPLVDEVTEFYDYWGEERLCMFNIQRMMDAAKTLENIEGWIVQLDDGEMIKVKTDWYLRRHRAMTFLRPRDIAAMVIAQELDDLKALMVGDGIDILPLLEVEQRVLSDIRGLEGAVKLIAPEEDYKMDRKEFVFKYREKAGSLFGMLMQRYSGKEPNYVEFFEKHMLKLYSLHQLNLVPSVAEAE